MLGDERSLGLGERAVQFLVDVAIPTLRSYGRVAEAFERLLVRGADVLGRGRHGGVAGAVQRAAGCGKVRVSA
jgi:hypothetical protein